MLGNKLRELRARRAAGETGFTLVELLVVVVIIVALAAIAVPIFLNQKDKADSAADQSSLASAAKFISAAVAQGDLKVDGAAASTTANTTLDSGDALSSATGNFSLEGMKGTVAAGTGQFCIQTVADGFAISNTSGGVKGITDTTPKGYKCDTTDPFKVVAVVP